MNNDLENIQLWTNQWLVNFSPPQSKLMTCSNKRIEYPDIYFDNVKLTKVDNRKHLGVILSHDLSWKQHINSIVNKVSKMTDVLRALKYDLH